MLCSLLVLLSICLQLIHWPVCGMRLLRLPGGMACVSCYSHECFERGYSCIPRVSTWCAILVLPKHHAAYLRRIHWEVALFALCCSSLLIAAPVWVIFAFLILRCDCLRLYLLANLIFVSVFIFFFKISCWTGFSRRISRIRHWSKWFRIWLIFY